MRRQAILVTLLASQIAVAALALLFQLHLRASMLAAFQEYGAPISLLTQVALSGWLLPGALATAGLLTAIALLAPLKRSQRHGLLGTGLVISSTALVFVVWIAFAAFFRPAF